MHLPDPASLTTSWSQQIADAAIAEFDCLVSLYESGQDDSGFIMTPWFTAVPGRVQFVRTNHVVSEAGQRVIIRHYIVQVPLDATDQLIKNGLTVRIAGGRDLSLTKIALTTQAGTNSSSAAVRTINCISEIVEVPDVPTSP